MALFLITQMIMMNKKDIPNRMVPNIRFSLEMKNERMSVRRSAQMSIGSSRESLIQSFFPASAQTKYLSIEMMTTNIADSQNA